MATLGADQPFLSRTPSKRSISAHIQKNKSWRVAKILLPHIGLTLFLVGYLMCGAAVFQHIEQDDDWKVVEARGWRILSSYSAAAGLIEGRCGSRLPADWRARLYASLGRLSSEHEGRPFLLHPDRHHRPHHILIPRWSYFESLLYALSILTTTGYTRVNPMTVKGQIFAIVYGLIGIPVMVLTAVDIGRFLSNGCLFAWAKVRRWMTAVLKRSDCCASDPLHSRIKTRLLPVYKGKGMSEVMGAMDKRGSEAAASDWSWDSDRMAEERGENLPLVVNASVLLIFCMIGAGCYMILLKEVGAPDFTYSFFITFNLVANLTMGEIPLVDDILILLFIVFFVSFGLAVLSMCAELAASELKWLFLQIHYFGRRMRRRQQSRMLSQMDVDVKELLKIIDEIRMKYPGKKDVTPADILAYIHTMGAMGSRRRRGTLAFIPSSMDGFKFADADEGETTAHAAFSSADSPSTPTTAPLQHSSSSRNANPQP